MKFQGHDTECRRALNWSGCTCQVPHPTQVSPICTNSQVSNMLYSPISFIACILFLECSCCLLSKISDSDLSALYSRSRTPYWAAHLYHEAGFFFFQKIKASPWSHDSLQDVMGVAGAGLAASPQTRPILQSNRPGTNWHGHRAKSWKWP